MSEERKDWSREGNATIRGIQRRLETTEAKAEASEAALRKSVANSLRDEGTKQKVANDFLKKHRGDEKPSQELINFLNKGKGNQGGIYDDDYETITGFEDLPWDQE